MCWRTEMRFDALTVQASHYCSIGLSVLLARASFVVQLYAVGNRRSDPTGREVDLSDEDFAPVEAAFPKNGDFE
jgi:hypothetical protein